jgi:hypothetical protein
MQHDEVIWQARAPAAAMHKHVATRERDARSALSRPPRRRERCPKHTAGG